MFDYLFNRINRNYNDLKFYYINARVSVNRMNRNYNDLKF